MEDTKQIPEQEITGQQAEITSENKTGENKEQISAQQGQKQDDPTVNKADGEFSGEENKGANQEKDSQLSDRESEKSVASIAQVPPFVARQPNSQTQRPSQVMENAPQIADGIRKLKKIKRPIRRIPQGSPLSPQISAPRMINLDENLDALLDSQLNLPVVNQSTPNETLNQEKMQAQPAQMNQQEVKKRVQPRFISDNDLMAPPRFIDQLMEDNLFTYKGAAVIAVIVFVLTLLIGRMIFGGETVVKDGLQGVVVNAEVPRGRARCGVAERTQGCVLYIMNPQRQDLQGRDFYDLASQLTGRQRFVVETGNMRYSNVKIRAGEIAQINIPPLQ